MLCISAVGQVERLRVHRRDADDAMQAMQPKVDGLRRHGGFVFGRESLF